MVQHHYDASTVLRTPPTSTVLRTPHGMAQHHYDASMPRSTDCRGPHIMEHHTAQIGRLYVGQFSRHPTGTTHAVPTNHAILAPAHVKHPRRSLANPHPQL